MGAFLLNIQAIRLAGKIQSQLLMAENSLDMNNLKIITKSLCCLILGIFGFMFSNAQPSADMVSYKADKSFHIGSKSILKLEGSTNVNAFTCNCTEPFSPQSFSVILDDKDPNTAAFRNTKLKIPIKSLDCGNKLMNKDLYKALNGDDHPYITIELLKVSQDKCNRLSELKNWLTIKALTRITLNGKSSEYWLTITARKLENDLYRFIGTKTLRMSEFGVDPPVAMMGIIKVRDEIQIDLDLEISVE